MARRIKIDTSALRESRDYRRVFASGAVTTIGTWVTYVTIPLQVAQLTGSYVAVGLLGAVQLIPMVVFGIWGGAIADAHNRKYVVMLTEFILMLATALLLANVIFGYNNIYLIYIVAFIFTSCDSIQRPSLEALIPQILPTKLLLSAGALSSMRYTFIGIVGPAFGGFIASQYGAQWCYTIDVASYAFSILLLMSLSSRAETKSGHNVNLRMMFSGFSYVKKRPDLIGTYAVDIIAMLFAFPNALFPFIAMQSGHEWALGWLYSAMSIGSFLATVTSGWTSHVVRRGRAIFLAAFTWGIAVMFAGIFDNIYAIIFFLIIAGCADMVSALFRGLIWNTTIPLDMRGRLAGIEMLSYMSGPQLGQVRATMVAQWTSLRVSLISGGIFCAAGIGVVAYGLRDLWNFDDRTNEYAVAERIARGETRES